MRWLQKQARMSNNTIDQRPESSQLPRPCPRSDLSRHQFLAVPAKVCRIFFSGLWPKTAPPRAPAHYRLWLQTSSPGLWPLREPPHHQWPLPAPPPHGLWPTLAPAWNRALRRLLLPRLPLWLLVFFCAASSAPPSSSADRIPCDVASMDPPTDVGLGVAQLVLSPVCSFLLTQLVFDVHLLGKPEHDFPVVHFRR